MSSIRSTARTRAVLIAPSCVAETGRALHERLALGYYDVGIVGLGSIGRRIAQGSKDLMWRSATIRFEPSIPQALRTMNNVILPLTSLSMRPRCTLFQRIFSGRMSSASFAANPSSLPSPR